MRLTRPAWRLGVALLAAGIASPTLAQDAPSAEVIAHVRFRTFDANADGRLAGREIDACACRSYDGDRDGAITWAEFLQRERGPAAAASGRGARIDVTKDVDPAHVTYRMGDRVEVNYDGAWYPGSVYRAEKGRYKVLRDEYTSDDRWVTAAEMRPLAFRRDSPRMPARRVPVGG
jgi:hypothetical protein